MKEFASKVGIYDKSLFYSRLHKEGIVPVTIANTIHLDINYIRKRRKKGFDTSKLKTFLICGIHSPKSIEAMVKFIQQIKPGEEATLFVTDINKEILDELKENPLEIPENIKLEFFQGDLTRLGLKGKSIDYARLDFTQNYIPVEGQTELFKEFNRVLSDRGIVSSVLEIMPKSKYPRVEKHPESGFNLLILSRKLIDQKTTESGLRPSYFKNTRKELNKITKNKTFHVVYEKLQKRQSFTPLKK